MPAVSQAQQEAMAIELARREKGAAPRRFKGMSAQQLKDYASTPRKGLPKRAPKRRARR